jgi:hypothetical protein
MTNSNRNIFVAVLLIALNIILACRLGRGSIWFTSASMAFYTKISNIGNNQIDQKRTTNLQVLIICLVLVVTGCIQEISSMKANALFLSINSYTPYHLLMHLTWSLGTIVLVASDFIYSKKSLSIYNCLSVLPGSSLSLLVYILLCVHLQFQHLK